MLARVLQPHQVDHVDEADAERRHLPGQKSHSSKRFEGRYVARRRHDHIDLLTLLLGTGPVPDADSACSVFARFLDREKGGGRLLSGDDHVDIVTARQTVLSSDQQGVGIRWQVHPHHGCTLVHDVIEKAGILM